MAQIIPTNFSNINWKYNDLNCIKNFDSIFSYSGFSKNFTAEYAEVSLRKYGNQKTVNNYAIFGLKENVDFARNITKYDSLKSEQRLNTDTIVQLTMSSDNGKRDSKFAKQFYNYLVISNTKENVSKYWRVKDGNLEVKTIVANELENDWQVSDMLVLPVDGKFNIEKRFERIING
jgi:hypothetical protein